MATAESYFESLGREVTKPYLDETYIYAELEPDLTQKVNTNIDETNKDTERFFNDNIAMYKDIIKTGSLSSRMKDLATLTRSGAPAVASWVEFQGSLKKLDKLTSEDSKIKFRNENFNLQKITGKNLVELNKEIGRIKHDLKTKGYAITTNADGEEIRIDSSKDFRKYELLVQSLSTGNGRDTATEASKYYGKFLEIAKKDLPHQNGKYFSELDPDQQLEWLRSVQAFYIQMWQKKNPKFSDGLVVNVLIPAMETQEKLLFNSIDAIDDEATKLVIADGVVKDYALTINTQGTNSLKHNSYTAGEGKVLDGFYGEGGLYQRRFNYYLELYDGDRNRALDALEKEMDFVFKTLVDSGQLNPDVADAVFTEWTFPKKDGSGMTTFAQLNPRSEKIVRNLENLLNEKVKTDNEAYLKNDLKQHRANLEKNIYMTREQYIKHIPYDTRDEAKAIYELGQRGGMTKDEFSGVNTELSIGINEYVVDNKALYDIPKKSKDDERLVANAVNLVRPNINRQFFRYYEIGKKNFKTELEARNWALEKTLLDIKNGKFKPGLIALGDATANIKDAPELGKQYSAIIGSSEQAAKEWLETDMAHDGEMPHLLMSRDALLNNKPVSPIYREVSKAYPLLDDKNVVYERLVRAKLIDPTDKRFAMYRGRLKPEVNIMESRLINHFPTMNKVMEYAALNTEKYAEITDSANDQEALPHFEGYGAFKASEESGYSEEIDLRELSIHSPEDDAAIKAGEEVNTIIHLIENNPHAKFGIYGIKGTDLKLTLGYLLENNLITGEERFDKNFQLKLFFTKMKLNENKKLQYSGETSYLNLPKIEEKDQELYDRITGKEGEKIPQWDRLEFLLPYIIRYKANTEL